MRENCSAGSDSLIWFSAKGEWRAEEERRNVYSEEFLGELRGVATTSHLSRRTSELPSKSSHKYCQNDDQETGPNRYGVPRDGAISLTLRCQDPEIDPAADREHEETDCYRENSSEYALEVDHPALFRLRDLR